MAGSLSDLTAACIRCGFCLESCPTFVLTGDEAQSPRGRIHIVRALEEGTTPWSDEARKPLDTCLGCLACETACPSGVQYGEILELARQRSLAAAPPPHFRAKKAFLDKVTDPVALRLQLVIGQFLPGRRVPKLLAKLLSDDPSSAVVPRLPPASNSSRPKSGSVAVLGGCVMEVLFPHVHAATERLLKRVGLSPFRTRGCCGALHAHAGYLEEGKRRASAVLAQADGKPLLTNSAGCGSWLRKNSPPGTVTEVTEMLIERGLLEALSRPPGIPGLTITYHDACHLAHGQGVRTAPRQLLAAVPGSRLVELSESDTCCGSAGIYNFLQPNMAARLAERKWARIVETGADCAAAGNPGCLAWLESTKPGGSDIKVAHTVELLDRALGEKP